MAPPSESPILRRELRCQPRKLLCNHKLSEKVYLHITAATRGLLVDVPAFAAMLVVVSSIDASWSWASSSVAFACAACSTAAGSTSNLSEYPHKPKAISQNIPTNHKQRQTACVLTNRADLGLAVRTVVIRIGNRLAALRALDIHGCFRMLVLSIAQADGAAASDAEIAARRTWLCRVETGGPLPGHHKQRCQTNIRTSQETGGISCGLASPSTPT